MDSSRQSAVVKQLRARLRELQRGTLPVAGAKGLSSTGIDALDELLAPDLFRPGMIVEWVVAGSGSGAARLATAMATHALQTGGAFVVLDDRREFYPPAAARLGLDLARMIVVRPSNRQEAVWTLEQALRCTGVAATLAWIGKFSDRVCRRLKLAAEHGEGLGIFLRPVEALRSPSWADLRWFAQAMQSSENTRHTSGRRVRVELVHCREGTPGGTVDLEIDDETGAVRVVPPLAAAASVPRAAGA